MLLFHLTVDVSILERSLHQLEKDSKLNEFCDTIVYDVKKMAFSRGPSKVKIFNFAQDQERILKTLVRLRECHTFNHILRTKTRSFSGQKPGQMVTVEEMFLRVWPLVHAEWRVLEGKVREGSLALSDVDLYFKVGGYAQLKQELGFMLGDDRKIRGCVQQILWYRSLVHYEDAACLLTKVKNTLGLEGDFALLEGLISIVSTVFKFTVIFVGFRGGARARTSLFAKSLPFLMLNS